MGRRTTYAQSVKDQVKQLLLGRKSYREITIATGVPKSTISTWFGKTINRPWTKKRQREHLRYIQKLGLTALRKKWREYREEQKQLAQKKIAEELPTYPLDNMGFHKSLLAMLYWAEGDKHRHASGPKFVNTDPALMVLYVTLLRKCYEIKEEKLRVRIHVHHYHSHAQVKKFWSRKLKIPITQFGKIYVKKRSKTKRFRRNFMGICFVYYGNSMIRRELMELGSALGRIITNNQSTPSKNASKEVAHTSL